MHPLVVNLELLKDSELEQKINDLTKKYFMTANFDLRSQIASIIEMYKEELGSRRQKELSKVLDQKNKDLDSLIKVN